MTAALLYGKEAAARLKPEIAAAARARPVRLASVLVGEADASVLYAKRQRAACEEVGIEYSLEKRPASTPQEEVLQLVRRLNEDPAVHGIIIQLPLPVRMDAALLQRAVRPEKDVEGVHPANLGLLVQDRGPFAPCTAAAAHYLISTACPERRGLAAVVVGHSRIVGRPLGLMLLHDLCTVTTCHVATRDLAAHTRRADILVSAVGKPHLIRGEMVKPGAVVIDIGVNRVALKTPDGGERRKIVGDVAFNEVAAVAKALTPVPGGVGPLTVTMLLRNVAAAAEKLAAAPATL